MHLVQFLDTVEKRGVAVIEGAAAFPIHGVSTTIELAQQAIDRGCTMEAIVTRLGRGKVLDYRQLLERRRILAPIDHPNPANCLVTGTGLTHLGSADARDRMHKRADADPESLSDSMKMFRLGLEGGKPAGGIPGAQPEWFYKGDGGIIVPPGGELPLPDFALDGGEEPEIVGIYLNGADGTPWRLGFALGNEYSDHVMERQNYLNLAHSKLRSCAIGPELRTGPLPAALSGESRILRGGEIIWRQPFLSGEDNMSHAIANLEHHHFKYELFRRPGAVNIHFLGTATLSFTDGIVARPGDVFEIELPQFGAPLRNTLRAVKTGFRYGLIGAL